MRHQRELVDRVEPDDVTHRPAGREQSAEAAIRKDSLDEVLAQPGIVEPAFFLDRQLGKVRHEGVGEQPPAGLLYSRTVPFAGTFKRTIMRSAQRTIRSR